MLFKHSFYILLALLLAAFGLGACSLLPQNAEQPELSGTSWTAQRIGELAISNGVHSTLYFEKDGVSGNAGCNSFFGGYNRSAEKLSFNQLGSTMMYCEAGMEQETAFLQALAGVSSYQVDKGLLLLFDAQGKTLMILAPIQHASLSGPVWELVSLNQNQGLTSTVLGTRLTAQFKDGQLSGSAGCNSYFAEYTLKDDQLTIQGAGSTEMFCTDPAGVMEQESAFLQTLPQAARYQIREQSLTIFNANGEMLLQFTALK